MDKMKRAPNFSEEEVDMLVQLVHIHKDILHNKQINVGSRREKDAAWDTITVIFNMNKEESTRRSRQNLKYKYENLNKGLRIKITDMKEEALSGVKIQSLAPHEELLRPMLQALDQARHSQLDVDDAILNEYCKTQVKSNQCEFDKMRKVIAQLAKDILMEEEKMAKEECEAAEEQCQAETVYFKLEMEKFQNEFEISKLKQELLCLEGRDLVNKEFLT